MWNSGSEVRGKRQQVSRFRENCKTVLLSEGFLVTTDSLNRHLISCRYHLTDPSTLICRVHDVYAHQTENLIIMPTLTRPKTLTSRHALQSKSSAIVEMAAQRSTSGMFAVERGCLSLTHLSRVTSENIATNHILPQSRFVGLHVFLDNLGLASNAFTRSWHPKLPISVR